MAALRAGADGAEVDARMSADGAVVLHHDAFIGPADLAAGCTAPVGAALSGLPYSRLGHLTTLSGLLDALEQWAKTAPLILNIELKDLPGEPGWDNAYPLARSVAGALGTRAVGSWLPPGGPGPAGRQTRTHMQVVVSSFDPESVRRFRRHAPEVATAVLVDEGDDWRRQLARAGEVMAVNPAEALAGAEMFSQAAEQGLAVVPWTVDDPARATELAGMGAAGLITNRPRALLKALGRRHPAGGAGRGD